MLKSKLEKLLNDPPESDLSFRDSMSLTHCPGSFPFPPLCHHPTLASVASSTPLGTLSTLSRGHVNTTHGPPLPMSLGSTQKPCPHPIFLPSSNQRDPRRPTDWQDSEPSQRGLSCLIEEEMRLLRPKDYKTQVVSACGEENHLLLPLIIPGKQLCLLGNQDNLIFFSAKSNQRTVRAGETALESTCHVRRLSGKIRKYARTPSPHFPMLLRLRMLPPKDVPILIPGTCEYGGLHGKED